MSATLNEDMSNQEEEDPLKTLESYAALVKQLRQDLAAREEEVKELKDELEEKVTELRKERDEIAFRAIQHTRNLHQKNVDWPQDLTAALASAVTNEDIASVLSQLEHECDDIASHRIKDSRGRSML